MVATRAQLLLLLVASIACASTVLWLQWQASSLLSLLDFPDLSLNSHHKSHKHHKGSKGHKHRKDRKHHKGRKNHKHGKHDRHPAPLSLTHFLSKLNKTLTALDHDLNKANWAFETNITDTNSRLATESQLKFNKKFLRLVEESQRYQRHRNKSDDWIDPKLNRQKHNKQKRVHQEQRQLEILDLSVAGLSKDVEKQQKLDKCVRAMSAVYGSAKYNGQPLEPTLTEILATSRDYKLLEDTFIGWRNATGPLMKDNFEEYIALSNNAVQETGHFDDMGEYWRAGYDMSPNELSKLSEDLWQQILPLYEQLHCYTRAKLATFYKNQTSTGFSKNDNLIPAHLLGNMWAQDWSNIADIVLPFHGKKAGEVDVTSELKRQGYDAVKIHQLSDDFYKSIGFDALPETFWTKSMLTKPEDREVVCHASAWDFSNDDLRIKMCTSINQENLVTIHHEQGHLQYDHQYRNQPYLFRNGASDFFHEAIGDTVTLSVLVPSHLEKIGLLHNVTQNPEQLINYQMKTALAKLTFMPFGYLIDQWRWMVASGKIKPSEYTSSWWELVRKYQGLKPPVPRSDETDFDPGSKYHVAANVPYLRYFLAHILQFQLHRGLCHAAEHKGPLHECNIYGNVRAGKLFKRMLSLGKSKRWQEALAVVELTDDQSNPEDSQDNEGDKPREVKLDASAILEYFAPLMDWLKEQNGDKQCTW